MSEINILQIFEGKTPDLEFQSLVHYKSIISIASVDNLIHLFFIQISSGKVYVVNNSQENDKIQAVFLKNWA